MHIYRTICARADPLAAIFDNNYMHALLHVCANVMYVCIIIDVYTYILYAYLYNYMYTCS